MIKISHRGNIDGKNPERENEPAYIQEALDQGYHCEVDVWFVDGEFRLGHDKPKYKFPFELIKNYSSKLWLHAKDISTFSKLYDIDSSGMYLNYFLHTTEDLVLTSKNYIWAFPGKQPIERSIAVMPEYNGDDVSSAIGVCSDLIKNY